MRVAPFLLLLACNSGGDDCTTASAMLCQRAVACADGGIARFVLGTGDLTYPNQAECQASFVLGCGTNDDAGTIDAGGCAQAAPSASCSASVNGGGVVVPAACLP